MSLKSPASSGRSGDPETLPDLLAAAFAGRHGEALRRRSEYRSFGTSYPELDRRGRQCAGLLGSLGLRAGDRAILWGANGPDWVTSLLAMFRAGIVPVPIDARSRPEFVARVGADTDARLLVRSRGQVDPGLAVPTLVLDTLDDRLAERDPGEPRSVSPGDVAEIFYTSGTTGEPKGVVLTHRNLTAEISMLRPVLDGLMNEVGIDQLVLLSVLPLSHVLEQVVGLLLPLSAGATVVYLDRISPPAIARALRSGGPTLPGAAGPSQRNAATAGVTAMVVVPRILELLATSLREASPIPGLPDALAALGHGLPPRARFLASTPIRRAFAPALRAFACGGASLDVDLERFWDGLGIPVIQGYGLTETSSALSFNPPAAPAVGGVGRPLAGIEVALGDRDEVLARGPSVTPGYYRNPAATSSALTDGWLHTGDVGSFDAAGNLRIRGRLKEVIVTAAGANVYPEDVEAALRAEPEVRDCAVVERHGRVHAVLLLGSAARPASEIVARANGRLDSAQQILGYDVWPDPDLPRTPTGKVARRAVAAALASTSGQARPARTRPGDPMDNLLSRLSHVPIASIHPEAALGPDLHLSSLDRLELVARIEDEIGVVIDEGEVAADTTVRDLRRLVDHGERAGRQAAAARWAVGIPARVFRHAFQRGFLFPYLRRSVALEVKGVEHLSDLGGPVVFAANHTSRLDVPSILQALPERWRERSVPLARAEFFEAPGQPVHSLALRALRGLVELGFGAVQLPQYRGFRESLRFAGELVDRGYSLIFFPEGQQSLDRQIAEFQPGIGLMVSALELPVVPVRLRGLDELARGGELRPRRAGHAAVTFGVPTRFRGESYGEIAAAVESAVRRL